MHDPRRTRRGPLALLLAIAAVVALVLGACSSDDGEDTATSAPPGTDGAGEAAFADETLRISAIPDQDPEVLNRLYGDVATYLSDELGVEVEYVPVTDYAASVSAFRIGDLDAVWFGGLTGVQARLQTPGATAVAQRDIDEDFTSVFIARTDAGIEPFDDVDGLTAVAGRSLTFGSESSTSGRLMPQFFLDQAGVSVDDLAGQPGFSGSHDATIELVQAGTFEVGALNSQVWESAVEEGTVDTDEVQVIFTTPPYYDYHWVVQPDLDERFGDGFTEAFTQALLDLDATVAEEAAILELFGAGAFIETEDANYADIEAVGRQAGLIE